MSKRTDIHKVLIIGSGPIIIGQACEFDYSGTQACKALRKLGYEIVLVNSNPATIMTDPETADVTYIEPLNVERLEQIIAKERPDALLPNLGGQSGLNLCSELAQAGILDKYNVKVIGVQVDAIERGEDRIEFKKSMDELGIDMARSQVAYSVEEGLAIADELGYPVVLRPAYTMGGAGGGLVYNKEELKTVMARGLQASLVGQVLVEESILGWEELELEVVRDEDGNMITVCFIENIDPLGVHTGDSFCSAPMLTISEEVQQRLQEKSHKVVDSVKVIGGCNVQWAHDPKTDRDIIIEINPRTSRSSALASKATGFPIALVSAMLAAGLTLKDIPCGKYGTLDKYVPNGDYVVIKFARWAFEKFKGVEDKLGTQMRAVGEVMSIGKTYKEAFQKAIRSLETGRYGLGHAKDFDTKSKEELLKMLITPSSERHFIMYEALRKGATVEEINEITKVKTWFIEQMKELVEEEEALIAGKGSLPSDDQLIAAKKDGFSDKYLSQILEVSEDEIRNHRIELGVEEAWEGVHVSGTEDRAYYYSTYNAEDKNPVSNDKPKILILGGGPNRIGQGIEFDYCFVHASLALKKLGFETIIVNCNPETVSTDYDTSDKLYFEPLTLEDVLSIYKKEKPVGVIEKAEELAKEIPDSFIPGQFDNKANAKAHFLTTGPEIWEDTEGEVDFFIAGVGTGGTLTGTGEYLKSKKPEIRVIALEPSDSPLLSGGEAGPHKLQGIGANFVPAVLNTEIYDEIFCAESEDAFRAAKLFAKKEGILVGISAGAALHAAITYAQKEENEGKTIVVLLPDSADRYYSTPLFGD